MMTSKSRALIFVSLFTSLALPALAQDGELFWVHREFALPSKVADYEKTTREFTAFVKANRDAMPSFSFKTWMSPDFSYTFITPFGKSMGGSDAFAREFGAIYAKEPAQWTDLWHRSGETFSAQDDIVYQLRDDLSYLPATERLTSEEQKFAQMDFYYIKPGWVLEAEAAAAEIKALFEKKKIADPYVVLQSVTGEGPLYLVKVMAKDPADYWMAHQKVFEQLGPEGKALFDKIFGLTRKFDTKQFFLRPDLSLAPPAK